jgi:hypothetical protein
MATLRKHRTIISCELDEPDAIVHSTDPKWWKRCEKLGGRFLMSGTNDDGRDTWRAHTAPIRSLVLGKPKERTAPTAKAGKKPVERAAKARGAKKAEARPGVASEPRR